MDLNISNPLFLVAFIPIAVIILLTLRKTNKEQIKHIKAISLIRFIVFTLIILSLSQPTILLSQQHEKVVFVVDRSASMKFHERDIQQLLTRSLAEKDVNDEYSIVSVGAEAAIESSMTKNHTDVDFRTEIQADDSNLEKGIELGASLFSGGQKGRIVLFTDGYETEGNVAREIELLEKKGVEVDIISFPPIRTTDVALTKLSVPHTSYLGENTSVQIQVDSTIDTTTRLRIQLNSETIIDEEIELQSGINEFMFTNLIEEEGYHLFEAEIFQPQDTISENNRQMAVSYSKGEPNVLIVEGKQDESINLYNALSAAQIDTKVVSPDYIPSTLSSLLEYETVIFANVSGTDVSQAKMDLIEVAVKEYGKGFIMTGGESSFGLGGYFETSIEQLLPVSMDIKGKKEIPSLALMIVVDRSGSMQGQKLDLAKEAAARTVSLLREQDYLGVIAFDDQPWEIVKTAPIKDKKAVEEKIRTISGGGGTNIYPALEEAYDQMLGNAAKRKHIILLTDGQSAVNGNYSALIQKGLEENITLSTVAIGRDSDRFLLQALAEEGTGRYYDVMDATVIPSILSRETVMATKTYIEDQPFYPTITRYAIEGLASTFGNGIPQMNAYIAVSEKDKAQTILISEKDDPILSVWQYGLGRTVAFTSDVTGKWSGHWPSWDKWSDFWVRTINWTFPNAEASTFQMDIKREGSQVEVNLLASEPILEPLIATVTKNDGSKVDATIQPVRPGEYKVKFQGEQGIHFIQLSKQSEDVQSSIFHAGFALGYSEEFIIPLKEANLFKEKQPMSSEELTKSPESIFRPLEKKLQDEISIQSSLLVVAFLLFLVELTIRRFGVPQWKVKLSKWLTWEKVKEKRKVTTSNGKKQDIYSVKEKSVHEKDEGKTRQPKQVPVPKGKDKNNVPKEERSSQMDRLLSAKKKRR
ncbi:VWA domain-containing protein [Bacillus carboniphilus]|uniref:VWA domain-containing protein n=1 Tax=Bacillus carboniphilus TaxID=86663 RepID=A0ABN0VYD8_9BACI